MVLLHSPIRRLAAGASFGMLLCAVLPNAAATDFYDSFDGQYFNSNYWTPCRTGHDPVWGCPPPNAREAQWFAWSQVWVEPANATHPSRLMLAARRQELWRCNTPYQTQPHQCRNYSWLGGFINTGTPNYDGGGTTKVRFQPGTTLSVRLRIPQSGPGYWPAVWMTPVWPDHHYFPEIDLMESFGKPDTWCTNYHYPGGETGVHKQSMKCVVGVGGGYHTVAIVWKKSTSTGKSTQLKYCLDGKFVQSLPNYAKGDTLAVLPNEPMILNLNLSVNGKKESWDEYDWRYNASTPEDIMMVDKVVATSDAQRPNCSDTLL